MASALINVPAEAKRGEIIEIKTLMSHIMETGYRRTATGELIPRNIITSFSCRTTAPRFFAPTCSRRSRQTRSSPFSPLRPRAANLISIGSATTVSSKPPRPPSPSNEIGLHDGRSGIVDVAAIAAASLSAARNRAGRAPIRLQLHEAGYPSHAERRHRQSRPAVGARRRSVVEWQDRCVEQGLRRLPS